MTDKRILIIVDKQLLREQLMSIVGSCSDCDLSRSAPTFCQKTPCGYGLGDELIDEIIRKSTVIEEEE